MVRRSNRRDSSLVSYQKPNMPLSSGLLSQFASWARIILMSPSHGKSGKKRKATPGDTEEERRVKSSEPRETDIRTRPDATEENEEPKRLDSRSHFPNVWQRTALCRTTYQKLRQKSLPLWAILHLRHLLGALQQQLIQPPQLVQTSDAPLPLLSQSQSPSHPRMFMNIERLASGSSCSRKRYGRRANYALTAVAYTIDQDTDLICVHPLWVAPRTNLINNNIKNNKFDDSDDSEDDDDVPLGSLRFDPVK
ncbi:hypothetical protein J3Q64DRAFT_1725431 [Phycomyces blakesleeanus]|uniref:Uncharacterized protein n=2 Tax=Phycomyces blakesleeanus TaxID=4837 RepID=A0A162Q7C3_PHYB8|nr:hypothetical protein PHYBLDRAFT_161365 [Phycomyces blakesleeanus NRRL 1555(-)]OAD80726.1 hypothetical protein PHYBLDRAFT_161365 [Phycomyces blakesleeanus NRRL 1555(-)]|eukprot:XP_018298766.1 hypothetical protein PHYBLDRAFT_161365 [Phycomyces blakesleeanus NRRL 1555(-)]